LATVQNRIINFLQSPFSQNTDIQAFAFVDSLIRIVFDEQGRLWFVASDVCKALGYAKSASAVVEQHCQPKGCTKMVHPSKGGEQEMLLITEGNLYRLTTKSNKPEAAAFEEWVFDEVLPTIRKKNHKKFAYSK
jgi:prophage antirepressor-like protein